MSGWLQKVDNFFNGGIGFHILFFVGCFFFFAFVFLYGIAFLASFGKADYPKGSEGYTPDVTVMVSAINEEQVDSELGPDQVWRRYGWEKIVAPYEAGFLDGTHTGQATSEVFTEFTSVRGHAIKYKNTRSDRDTVWAIWRPNLPERGIYEVSVFVPGQHATTVEARYHIHGVAGVGSELVVRLNQSRYYDQWVPLVVIA